MHPLRGEIVTPPLYRTRFPGHAVALRGAPEGGVNACGASVERAQVAVFLDEPLAIVACDDVADGVADVVNRLEDAAVDGLLLRRSEEPLHDAIRLGLADEGVAWQDAPELHLLLEAVGREVAAVVMAEREATGGVGGEVAELLADGHDERVVGLEAGAAIRHVPSQDLGVPAFRDAEDPDLAVLDGGDLRGVDRPHDVRRFGDDLPVVAVLVPAVGAVGREKGVLTHQAQEPLARDADAVAHAQAGPDLSVALAGPGRGLQVPLDSGEQSLVGDCGLGPAPCRRSRRQGALRRRRLGGVEAGARHVRGLADAPDAVGLATGGGGRLGHQRDFLRAKGPGRSFLARSSSTSMLGSPMRCMAVASSVLAVSASRSLSALSAFWRHVRA